ncbi:MAG: ribonuclease III [bacterium]
MQLKSSRQNKTKTALFIGRFQPFHKGHFQTLVKLATEYKSLIVGIGSAQEGFTGKNPFTAKEREEMISKTLQEKITNFRVIQIPDINDDTQWVNHVLSLTGPFDATFTNNPHVLRLFKQAGIEVKKHHLIQPDVYKATNIREAMAEEKPWRQLVQPVVLKQLDAIHAEDRLKTLNNKRGAENLLNKLGIHTRNTKLWKVALTHKSYINEHKLPVTSCNERLEFLGDAILALIITEYLFQHYPEAEEGAMTSQRSALVRTENLAEKATLLHLGQYVQMSFGEEKGGGRENTSNLANIFEACTGALYLDQGLERTRQFLRRYLLQDLPETLEHQQTKDYKSKLQELIQERFKKLPTYEMIKEEGAEHNKVFTIAAKHDGKILGKGTGKNKQQAQQEAAKKAYEKLTLKSASKEKTD